MRVSRIQNITSRAKKHVPFLMAVEFPAIPAALAILTICFSVLLKRFLGFRRSSSRRACRAS